MKWLDKYQNGDIDFDGVAKAVRNVESLDGKLMWNPQSSATGLFGQRFSEIKNDYKGSRKEFAKDTTAQKHYFKKRFHEGLEDSDTTSLKRDAYELYEEYSPQIENFEYSKEDISVLSNFLGRQGTRKFLGNHVRDGKPLSEALPKIYGEGKKQSNKTPQEYLDKAREYYDPKPKQNGGWLDKFQNGDKKSIMDIEATPQELTYDPENKDANKWDAWDYYRDNGNAALQDEVYDPIVDRMYEGREEIWASQHPTGKEIMGKLQRVGDDAQGIPRILPQPDEYLKALAERVKDLPDDDIQNIMETDFSDINILNAYKKLKKAMPKDMSVKEAWHHYNQLKKYVDAGYSFQNGGVVKDNQGYWNPANHGKVVEIDSNNITMKGVNQELLGVSDTGDTKVMKPGKNYKFKGTKVREYPVTQNGGWLDKY